MRKRIPANSQRNPYEMLRGGGGGGRELGVYKGNLR